MIEGAFGGNPVWLAEWLCEEISLAPGMQVLDLGCGRAKSSIFLTREFDVDVVAADLWIDPNENRRRIAEAGLENRITPLRVDARHLPLAHGTFDAIVAFDSYQYFGTDCLYLPYVAQFLKVGGVLAFASAGLTHDFNGPVPDHLKRFWIPSTWCIRTAAWWADHWGRTGLLDLRFADTLEDGWRHWLQWAEAIDSSDWYLETLKQDAGRYLGYIRVAATKRPDTPHLLYDLSTGEPVNS